MLTYRASEKDRGRKLYNILRRDMQISLTLVRRLKWSGGLFVNNEPAHTDRLIVPGDVITADVTVTEGESTLEPQDGPLEVLYEDDALLIVNKPCGILTHPSRSRFYGTLANYAYGYLLQSGASGVCHVVNRLDRDTGGVVLFAKNAHYKALACEVLAGENSVKEYTALVMGRPETPCGVIDIPIRRLSGGSMLRVASPDGQKAVTVYETVSHGTVCGEEVTQLRLRLLTGRTHQIRVHCLASGFPILGDPQYGTPQSAALSEKLGMTMQALYATSLSFPWNGGRISVDAPVRREDISKIIETLKI